MNTRPPALRLVLEADGLFSPQLGAEAKSVFKVHPTFIGERDGSIDARS